MTRDRLYLNSILDSINRIERYTNVDRDRFMNTPMMQDAVIRNLEIIGEAVKNLSSELRAKNSQVPWRDIAGLRDVLIHDYLNVDLNEIWALLDQDLPELKRNIELILHDLP